jgi:uncharacterized protein
MTFVRWVVQVLVILFLVRLALRMIGGMRRRSGAGPARRSPTPPERIGGTLVRDPQCGTHIPKDRAVVHGRGDATQYFCSTTCRDAWLAAQPSVAHSRGA